MKPSSSKWRNPGKLKSFLWSVLHKKILTNVQRVSRGFTSNASCPICSSADESLLHLFRDCPRSASIWRSFPKPGNISNSFSLYWNGWIYAQLHCHAAVENDVKWCNLFVFIYWFIWKWRNKQVFDPSFIMPVCFKKVIWDYALEWKKEHNRAKADTMYSYSMLSWKMPPLNFFKLNIDGTRATASGKIGAGGVIRNHAGTWIIGFQINLGVGEILTAEA
ncbi:hypothetical protein ACLB2K_055705 [Fragaria x ananassa]